MKDFLQFARPSEPQFAAIDAALPLREIQTLMQPGLEKSAIKLLVGEVAPARIRVDPHQIKQVLINLVQNGADSIGHDGTVTLRARRDEKRLDHRPMDVVILEVSDTGAGITPEAEKRLFDPFFTTKEFGTGLGLPIAARIVEKNHGALQYQTQADHGSDVRHHSSPAPPMSSQPPKILLVEDDPAIATTLRRVLADEDYDTVQSRPPPKAAWPRLRPGHSTW